MLCNSHKPDSFAFSSIGVRMGESHIDWHCYGGEFMSIPYALVQNKPLIS